MPIPPANPKADLATLYRQKLANPDYVAWKNKPVLSQGYQDFPEEDHIKYARAQIAKNLVLPANTKALMIPVVPSSKITIDGDIQDQEWQQAARIPLEPKETGSILYLQADNDWLYLAVDEPGDTTEAGYDQFQFYFHVDIDPTIKNECIHVARSAATSGAYRETTVKWQGDPQKNEAERWKLYPISDSGIYRMAKGASTMRQHRQFEAKLNLAECGLTIGSPFPAFVKVETDPLLVDGKFKQRLYLGVLGDQNKPVWMIMKADGIQNSAARMPLFLPSDKPREQKTASTSPIPPSNSKALLAYDNFSNYSTGNLPGKPLRGIGFEHGGVWAGIAGNSSTKVKDAATVKAKGATPSAFPNNAVEVMVKGDNSNLRGLLDLSQNSPFAMAGLYSASDRTIGGGNVSSTVYLSFLFRAASLSAHPNEYGGLQLSRNDSDQTGVLIGKAAPKSAFSIHSSESNLAEVLLNRDGTGNFHIMDNEPHLFVVKIVFSPSSADAIKVWMDPNLNSGEGEQNSNTTYVCNTTGHYRFDRILLRGGAASQFDFGEIRIGTTWAAVLSPSVAVESKDSAVQLDQSRRLIDILQGSRWQWFNDGNLTLKTGYSVDFFKDGTGRFGWKNTLRYEGWFE